MNTSFCFLTELNFIIGILFVTLLFINIKNEDKEIFLDKFYCYCY